LRRKAAEGGVDTRGDENGRPVIASPTCAGKVRMLVEQRGFVTINYAVRANLQCRIFRSLSLPRKRNNLMFQKRLTVLLFWYLETQATYTDGPSVMDEKGSSDKWRVLRLKPKERQSP
jgi:hypothetical protein